MRTINFFVSCNQSVIVVVQDLLVYVSIIESDNIGYVFYIRYVFQEQDRAHLL